MAYDPNDFQDQAALFAILQRQELINAQNQLQSKPQVADCSRRESLEELEKQQAKEEKRSRAKARKLESEIAARIVECKKCNCRVPQINLMSTVNTCKKCTDIEMFIYIIVVIAVLIVIVTLGNSFKAKQDKNQLLIDVTIAALTVIVTLIIGLRAKNKHKQFVEAKLKAEQQAAEAKLKVEQQAAEAKLKAEAAYAKSSGNRAGEEKVIEIAPSVTMTFCWCPAGKFTMGSPEDEEDRVSNENQVKVTLSKGFWMAKTEVTQAQWQAVMGHNPSNFKGTNRPVENVIWNDAQEFLTKVNAIVGNSDGGKMVLPTETQWEYGARAGEAGMYSGGTLDEVAWYAGNSGSETHPVGTKKPNAWGLHDMSGNLWEWCADWYERELKGGIDPQGASSGTNRVFRGGSWNRIAGNCRVAYRNNDVPSRSSFSIGVRVARSSVQYRAASSERSESLRVAADFL